MVLKPNVIKKFITKNKYSRPGTKRSRTTKIAWHYTGQHDVPAKNTVSYFSNVVANGYKVNGRYIYASSHYVMGLEGEIYYIVPEEEIAYTTNSANYYSIGIECATTGSDDHYTEKEYESMVKLGAYLADKYGLDPRKDFIRHYDVTGKICPRYFVNNLRAWKKFKQDCYDYLQNANKVETTKTKYLRVLQDVNIHKTPDFNSSSVIGEVKAGTCVTIVKEIVDTGCSTHMYLVKAGYYITASTKYVEVFER